MKKENFYWIVIAILVLVVANMLIFSDFPVMGSQEISHDEMDVDEMREHFISARNDIQKDLLPQGKYRCCLEKPCTYCIEKDPKHGPGAECSCLDDVVNGVHPCGECIGEILEGHGNPYLKEYFAEAIAEEVGMKHKDTIQEIIDEKYI